MEPRQQIERWLEQASEAGYGAMASMDVAKRLITHGLEALDEIDKLHDLRDRMADILSRLAEERNKCATLQSRLELAEKLHSELLYAVACKFPGETRHETALRYIKERESREVACESAKQESRNDQ